MFEQLEPRVLLSVNPTLTDTKVTFDVLAESGLIEDIPDVHLRTNDSGELEWSSTGSVGSWSNDLDSGKGGKQTLVLGDEDSVDVFLRVDGVSGGEITDIFSNLFDDPISGFFLHDLFTGGADLNVRATKIRVMDGATVSTRDIDASSVDPLLLPGEAQQLGASQSDSGNLKFNAPKIVLASGSATVAHADSGLLPGAVTMSAIGSLDDITSSFVTLPLLPNVTITSGTIEMTDAQVTGGDITIKAESDSADLFDDAGTFGEFGDKLTESIAEFVGGLSLIGGAAISEATAKVNVSGGSIDATGDLIVQSDALTDAQVKTISFFLGAAYAHTIPTARINIQDGAVLSAAGNVQLTSLADAVLNAGAWQSFAGVSSFVESINIVLAAGYSDLTAETHLTADSSIDAGGDVLIRADAQRDIAVSASASAAADGKLAFATALNVGFTAADAKLDGTITAGGDVTVKAEQNTAENAADASSGVGTGFFASLVQQNVAAGGTLELGATLFATALRQGNDNVLRSFRDSQNEWGFSASISLGVHFNEITARIGPAASVTAGGDVSVLADAKEVPSQSAAASVKSSSGGAPLTSLNDSYKAWADKNRGVVNTRDKSTAIAITVGAYDTVAKAYIDDNATVDAGGDVVVDSLSNVPYEITWHTLGSASELLDYLNSNLGIQNGFFNSWAQATAAAKEKSFGGNFNAIGYKNVSKAYIGEGATVTAAGDVKVKAKTKLSTVGFAGTLYGTVDSAGSGVGGAVIGDVPLIVTEAVIKSGAVVQAASVLVHADTKGRSIALGNQIGLGESFSFNGVLTWQWADHRTVAKIDDGAEVTTSAAVMIVDKEFDLASAANPLGLLLLSPIPTFNPNEDLDGEGATRVDPDLDYIYLPYDHGLSTGDPLVYAHGPDGEPIVGLEDGYTYYAIVDTSGPDNRLQLAATLADADADTAIDLELTGATDTAGAAHSLYPALAPTAAVDTTNDTFDYGFAHRLVDGQPVLYRNGDNDPASDTTSIGGLADGNIYYAQIVDETTIRLMASQQDAYDGVNPIALDLTSTSGDGHSLTPRLDRTYPDGFDPSIAVDPTNETIDYGRNHGFSDGEEVIYTADSGDTIGNLVDGETYTISVVDETTFRLVGDSMPFHDLDWAGGAGESHQFTPVENGVLVDNPILSLDSNNDGVVTTADDGVLTIDGDSYTLDASLQVIAEDETKVYSGAGAATSGRAGGAGLSLVNHIINRNTQAIIGNEQYLLGTGRFAPGVGVDSGGVINLGYAHGFSDGDVVGYTSGGDFTIVGLLDRQTYVVGDSTSHTFRLARTAAEFTATLEPTTSNVDDVTDTIDLGYTHGFQLGDTVLYSAGGGTPIDGLEDGAVYYVIPVSTTEIALALTDRDALREHRNIFAPLIHVTNSDRVAFPYLHGLSDDQPVVYTAGGGTPIGGLTEGATYYVKLVDDTTIKLAATPAGAAIALDTTLARGETHALQPGFDPTTAVDTTLNTIDLGYEHGLRTGQAVRYDAVTGTPVAAAEADGLYHAIVIDESTIALASTQDQALHGQSWLFHPELHVDFDTDTLEFYTAHGFQDGDEVRFTIGDVGTPSSTQLVDGNTYFVRTVSGQPSQLQLEDSAGTLIDFDLPDGDDLFFLQSTDRIALDTSSSTAGDVHTIRPDRHIGLDASSATGTNHTFHLALNPAGANQPTHAIGRAFDPTTAVDSAADEIDLGYTHNLTTGQKVTYSAGEGKGISGIGHGETFFVVVVDATTIQLSETRELAEAVIPEVISLDNSSATGDGHTIGATITTQPVVDGTQGHIDLGRLHGFETGDEVVYRNGGGTSIHDADSATDLVDGDSYFVIVVDDATIRLASSKANALADTALHLDAATATGSNHSFEDPDSATGFVDAAGNINVKAVNRGEVISASIAATMIGDYPWGATRSGMRTKDAEALDKPDHGLGVAGDASITVLNQIARAYLRSADVTGDADLTVTAKDTTNVFVYTGSLVLSTLPTTLIGGSADFEVLGVAGSLIINVFLNEVDAFIENSDVTLGGDLTLSAVTDQEAGGVASSLASIAKGQGIAGSIVINDVDTLTNASIRDGSDVRTAGDITVSANETNRLIAAAGGLGLSFGGKENSTSAGVGIGIGVNTVSNDTGTLATIVDSDASAGGAVSILADTDTTIISTAMGFASSSAQAANALALAASLSLNRVDTRTRASIRRRKATGVTGADGVHIIADDDTDIRSISGGGAFAASSENAGAGALALSINLIENDVEAFAQDTVVDSTAGDVLVTAHSEPTITSFAIAGSFSTGLSLTGSFSINDVNNDTKAYLTGTTSVFADGNVVVASDDAMGIVSGAGAVAAGENLDGTSYPVVGVANSTSLSSNNTHAYIDNAIDVQANANQASTFIDTGKIDSDGSRTTTAIKGVAVTAVSHDDIVNLAAAGSGSATSNAAAASATVTEMDESTQAWIGQGTTINRATTGEFDSQSVIVRAAERTDLFGLAGAIAVTISEKGGTGAGIDVAVIDKDTRAWIDAAAEIEAQRNVIVEALSKEKLISMAGSIGAGGNVAVAGGVGVSVYDITTKAFIAGQDTDIGLDGAVVSADGSVVVQAEESLELDMGAGSVAVGSLSIGGSIGVPVITKTTEAYIGNGATVDALGLRASIDVNDGTFTTSHADDVDATGEITTVDLDNNDISDQDLLQDRDATPVTRTGFKGLAVTAINRDDVELYGLGLGLTDKTAVQASSNVHVMDATTKAYIDDNAIVNQDRAGAHADQEVFVAAGSDLFHFAIAGVAAGSAGDGSSVVFTPGVDVASIKNTTKAYIGQSAIVDASADVIVRADATEDVAIVAGSMGASFSSSLAIAGSGAVSVVHVDNTTHAYIDQDAQVYAGGNVVVDAQDNTDLDIIAGSASLAISSKAAGAAGAGVSVGTIKKDTQAWIASGASVDAEGNSSDLNVLTGDFDTDDSFETTTARGVSVSAASSEDAFLLGASGAIAIAEFSLAFAGSVTVTTINSDTLAYIGSGALINQNTTAPNADQDVSVAAVNDVNVHAITGSGGISLAAIYGSVDAGAIRNDTQAFIGGTVSAADDVRVHALADREIKQRVASTGLGLLGINGSVGVWSISGNLDSNHLRNDFNGKTIGDYGDDEAGVNITGKLARYDSTDSNRGDNSNRVQRITDDAALKSQLDTDLDTDLTTDLQTGTSAFIADDAVILASDEVNVTARDRVEADMKSGAANLGLITLGASINQLTSKANVSAYIGDSAVIGSDAAPVGSVTVQANSVVPSAEVVGIAASGGALLAGTGVDVGIDIKPDVSAYTESNVSIDAAGEIEVAADAAGFAKTDAVGVTLAIGAAGGISLASSLVRPDVEASIGSGNNIEASDLTVAASKSLIDGKSNTAVTTGFSVAGGALLGFQGTGILAASEGLTQAALGTDSNINVSGTILVDADTTTGQRADALGGSTGIVALGASQARVATATTTRAKVESGVNITAAELQVHADGSDGHNVRSETSEAAFIGLGGVGVGAAALGTIDAASVTEAVITGSQGANLIDVDALEIEADHLIDFEGSALNSSIKLIGGFSGSELDVNLTPSVTTRIGNGAKIEADDIFIDTTNRTISSGTTARSRAGSLLDSGIGATSNVDLTPTTLAEVGDNATVSLTGDPDAPGDFIIRAHNDSEAFNNTEVDNASSFPSSTGRSNITLDGYDADVRIGDSTLNSLGEITLAAWSQAEIKAEAAAIVAGVDGKPKSRANANLDSQNSITLESGALLVAEDDVNLLAGINRVPLSTDNRFPQTNDFTVQADSRAIALTADRDADAGGSATIDQHNQVLIQVDSGSNPATVQTVADVNILTIEGFATAELETERTAGTGRKRNSGGRADATNAVVVDGIIEVGTKNQQFLTIDNDGNPTAQSEGVTFTINEGTLAESIHSRLNELLVLMVDYTDTPAEAIYLSEIQFWIQVINDLGGEASYDPTLNEVDISRQVDAQFIDVENVTARSGDIIVRADSLTGGGQLIAPGDTSIVIENNSEASLRLDDLTIPESSGGRLFFNLDSMESNANINNANDDSVPGSASFIFDVAGSSAQPLIDVRNVPIALHTTPAQIFLEGDISNISGDVNIDGGDGSVLAFGSIQAGNLNIDSGGDFVLSDTDWFHVSGLPQELYETPADANEDAKSQVRTPRSPRTGSNSTIAAGNVFISAQNLNINGTIQSGLPDQSLIIQDTERRVETDLRDAGDAGSIIKSGFTGTSNTVQKNRYYDQDGLFSPAGESGTFSWGFTGLTPGQYAVYTTTGSLFLSDEDVTFNVFENFGQTLIGSTALDNTATADSQYDGFDWTLIGEFNVVGNVLSVELTKGTNVAAIADAIRLVRITDLDQDIADFQAEHAAGGAQRHEIPAEYLSEPGTVVYDAVENRLEVTKAFEVTGGYMELAGHILNTGGGELRVLDGYGRIDIDNQTTYDVVLPDLDAGQGTDDTAGIEGRISITDTARTVLDADGNPTFHRTVITRLGNQVTVLDNSTLDLNGDPSNAVTTVGRTGTYNPAPDQRYIWTTAQSSSDTVRYELLDTKTKPQEIRDVGGLQNHPNATEVRISFPDTPTPLLDGEYVVTDADAAVYKYAFDESIVNNFGLLEITRYKRFLQDDKFDYKLTRQQGRTEYHEHSVVASQPIAIEFIGYDQGQIDVQSQGAVILGGTLASRGGDVNVNSAASITSDSAAGSILAVDISINAATGIGADNGATPVNVELIDTPGALLSAATTTGNLHIAAASDLNILDVQAAAGDVTLSALGDLTAANAAALITGSSITLDAQGAIGDSARFFPIDSGPTDADVVTATARNDLYLREVAGDLALVRAESTLGDVTIDVAAGSLFDANEADEVFDDAARDRLIEIWSDLGLVGEQADARVQEFISSIKTERESEYHQYWNLRGLTEITDDSGTVTGYTADPYDPAFVFTFTDAQRDARFAAGLSVADVDALEAANTAAYHDLHLVYGPGGTYDTVNDPDNGSDDYDPTTYDPNFTYEMTAAEQTQLTDNLVWTVDELLFGLPTAVVEPTSDTETVVENPNIAGDNVTVTTSANFGRDATGVQTILVPTGDVTDIVDEDIKVALLAAEPDDMAFFVYVEDGANGTPDAHELTRWVPGDPTTDLDTDGLLDTGEFNLIQLTPRQDVDVDAQGTLNIETRGQIFIGSETDLRLGKIVNSTWGDTRIKVEGNLLSAGGNLINVNNANINTSGLILESADGDIGTPDTVLTYLLWGSTPLVARAAGDIYLHAHSSTPLGTIFAGGDVSITSSRAIFDRNDVGALALTNIVAHNLTLSAISLGNADDRVEIDITGSLSGNVDGEIGIASPSDLSVDGLIARSRIDLNTDGNLRLGRVEAGQPVTLEAAGSIFDLNADGLNLYIDQATLTAAGDIGTAEDPIEALLDADTTATAIGESHITEALPPSGFFREGPALTTLGEDVVLGDIDGDGDLDALTSSRTQSWIYLNDGDANFTPSALAIPGRAAWGDTDGDDDLDLFIASPTGVHTVMLNQGGAQGGTEGDFADSGQLIDDSRGPGDVTDVEFADLDADTHLDVVLVDDGNNSLTTWLNDGTGTFVINKSSVLFPSRAETGIVMGDFTGDRIPDGMLFTSIGLLQYVGAGDGTFALGTGNIASGADIRDVAAGNLDNDDSQYLDVFAATETGHRVALADGDGSFTNRSTVGIGDPPTGVDVADLDRDGDLDAFVVDPTLPSRVWFNTTGNGHYANSGQALGTGGAKVALGDLDGDGDDDAFVLNERVWLNMPNHRFDPQGYLAVENQPAGTLVGTVAATTEDPAGLTFAPAEGASLVPFAIDSAGNITVVDPTALSIGSTFELPIEVSNPTGLTTQATITVNVIDLVEPPVVDAAIFSIAEDAATGAPVGTVTAADPESSLGDRVGGFNITGGSGASLFSIDPDTGDLTYNGSGLDHETAPQLTLLIEAQDRGGNVSASPTEITIDVSDVNEAPIALAVQNINVFEDRVTGDPLGKITAADPEGTGLTFTLVSGDATHITVDPNTGELFVGINPDAFSDMSSSPSFGFEVEDATGLTTLTTVQFTIFPFINALTFNIGENRLDGELVGTATVSDPNLSNTLTWSIVSATGVGADAYTIDPDTGDISVLDGSLTDYENPDARHVILTLLVTDGGGLTATATAAINLIDFNSPPTGLNIFSSFIGEGMQTTGLPILDEDAPAGTVIQSAFSPIFRSFIDTDVNNGDRLTFSLLPIHNTDAFAVDPATNLITLVDPSVLDFENQIFITRLSDGAQVLAAASFIEVVTDSEGQSAYRQRIISPGNVDESAEVFTGQAFDALESIVPGEPIGTVAAVTDAGDVFSIEGGDGTFAIDPTTGELTLADGQALDFEDTTSHTLTVRVTSATNTDETTVQVNVLDVDESDLAITKTADTLAVVTEGDTVTYTITVTNPGDQDAFGATIADLFNGLSNLELLTFQGSFGASTTVTTGPIPGGLFDTINLPIGGTIIYTVTGTADPHNADNPMAVDGLLTSGARIVAPFTDVVPENNGSSGPELVVTLSPGQGMTQFRDSYQVIDTRASRSVALGDLDGDGDLDAWISMFLGDRIWFNAGDGTTGGFADFSNFSSRVVALGDIDNDGDLDAVLGGEETDYVLFNNGTGHFTDSGQRLQAVRTGDLSPLPTDVDLILSDMDNDGDLDLYSATVDGNEHVLYLNDGTGTFTQKPLPRSQFGSLGGQAAGAAGDIDRDSNTDVIHATPNAQTLVFDNDGTPAFTQSQFLITGSVASAVTLGDINADGWLDAITGRTLGGDAILINTAGTLTQTGAIANANTRRNLLGDFTADGLPDVLSIHDSEPNSVWINQADGTFAELPIDPELSVLTDTQSAALGDLDGDGDLDAFLVTFDSGAHIWLGHTGPKVTLAAPLETDEDTPLPITGLSGVDPRGGNVTLTLAVDAAEGNLRHNGTTAQSFVFNGTPDEVTALANQVVFHPAPHVNGKTFLMTEVTDGTDTHQRNILMPVNPINDAPTLTVPTSLAAPEDTVVSLSSIDVTDIESDILTLRLTASNGILNAPGLLQSGPLITIGTLPDGFDSLLSTLEFIPTRDFHGDATVIAELIDGEHYIRRSINIEYTPVNDVPLLGFPTALTTFEDSTLNIGGFLLPGTIVNDGDDDLLTMTLTVDNGTLLLPLNGLAGSTLSLAARSKQLNADLSALHFTPTGDFAGDATINITVDDGTVTVAHTLTVTVLEDGLPDVNDPGKLLLLPTLTQLSETALTTTRIKVADMVILDDVLGTNTLALTGDHADLFEIDANQLYLRAGTTLDHEANPFLRVNVELDDTDPTIGSDPDSQAPFTLTITDVNESPVIEDQLFEIDENAPAGIAVGTVAAIDPEAGPLTFEITAGNESGAFAIDPLTGQLTVADSAQVNFESTPIFDLTVEVTDQGTPSLSNDATITVNLNDVNEAPTINETSFDVDEGLLVVGNITATDPDLPGDTISFTITGSGADDILFSITLNGELSFLAPPDFEIPGDADADNVYEVEIQADDGNVLSTSQTILVTVLNTAPTTPIDTDATDNTVQEGAANGEVVGVTASSTDPAGTAVSFTLTDDAEGRFTIDPLTGVVWVADGALLDGDDTHTITVQASDGAGGTSTSEFNITVINAVPVIESLISSATVANKALPGDTITITGSYSDAGVPDTHSVSIVWDDTDITHIVGPDLQIDPISKTFTATHTYSTGGIFTIEVTVADDNGATTSATTTAVVTGARLTTDGEIQIVGSDGVDDAYLKFVRIRGETFVNLETLFTGQGKVEWGPFNRADVNRISAYMYDGDDVVTVQDQVHIDALIDGGSGNDILTGGGGNDLILGQAGHDVLIGGSGNDELHGGDDRDMLIGGIGADMLQGGADDDLLIGGRTSYDNNLNALRLILSEWTSSRTYQERIDNIRNAGGPFLKGTKLSLVTSGKKQTVFGDGEADELTGGSGSDWYFIDMEDVLNGKEELEELDTIGF